MKRSGFQRNFKLTSRDSGALAGIMELLLKGKTRGIL